MEVMAIKKGRNGFIEVFPVEGLGTSFEIVVNHCNKDGIVDDDGVQTNNGIKI
ncbi:hypothetical protein [Filifactor alocis]|uniref:hypothetical protein n=1 Tax=Filifactor alocis TaxID=143361 RepID=UPI003F9FCD04